MPFPPRPAAADAEAEPPPPFAKKAGKKKFGKKSQRKAAPVQKSMMQSGRSMAGGGR